MKWEAACAKKYELQVSNDAQEWKTVYANKDGRGGTEQIELEPVTARYVKLAGISRATQFGYSLFEFEIYGEKPKRDRRTDSASFYQVGTDRCQR